MQYLSFFRRPVCLIFSGMVSGIALFLLLFSSFSFADMGNEDEGIPQEDNEIMGGAQQGAVRPSCLDNWADWPESDQLREDAPWSLQFIPYEDLTTRRRYRREYFLDINNDGLEDYMYASKILENRAEECVALNNGDGTWEVVYKCHSYQHEFHGDCANIE